jgi:hypothetical protein
VLGFRGFEVEMAETVHGFPPDQNEGHPDIIRHQPSFENPSFISV